MGLPGDGYIAPQMIQGIVDGRRFIVCDDHIDDPFGSVGVWCEICHIMASLSELDVVFAMVITSSDLDDTAITGQFFRASFLSCATDFIALF